MKKNGDVLTEEGDVLTMDWIILKNEVSKGADGETVLQLLLDVGELSDKLAQYQGYGYG